MSCRAWYTLWRTLSGREERILFQQNNIENREVLKKWVRSKGYGYTPVYGGFKKDVKDEEGNVVGKVDSPGFEPEHALLIMARNEKRFYKSFIS